MTTGRFARQQRLLKSSDFRYVFDHPTRFSDKFLTVLARANHRSHARLGLAVSKKNVRLAVRRNRLKRVIRESFRNWQEKLVGWDVIVMVRSGADRLTNQELRTALETHWQKLTQSCAES